MAPLLIRREPEAREEKAMTGKVTKFTLRKELRLWIRADPRLYFSMGA
jgi:hypothetical protein